ncbi:hypothetical protein HYV73_00270 [Candidatus Uhrbacteria bacterium]|nr:hypothetical protein [Candidatus Uhrbacteria bacterium]
MLIDVAIYRTLEKRLMDLKQQFLKVYSTLPLGIRKEIVIVLDAPVGPVSWEAAYLEVENRTAVSEVILTKLHELQII